MRLNPHARFTYPLRAGYAYFVSKRFELAVTAFEKAIRLNPRNRGSVWAWRAAAYAQLGRMEEARAATEEALKKRPNFSIHGYFGRSKMKGEPKGLLKEGFRKAGLPEYPPAK